MPEVILPKTSLSKSLKAILIGLIALVLIAIVFIAYRMIFQFNNKDVREYIMDEAKKYADPQAAFKVIQDGVEYVLASHNLTQQVLKMAKYNKSTNEQELVNAAINQCKAFKYLPS